MSKMANRKNQPNKGKVSNAPKKPVKKPRQIRFYLTDDAPEILDEIGRRMPELSETDIVRIHLLKALKATKDAGYKLAFPFEFSILHPDSEFDTKALSFNEKSR